MKRTFTWAALAIAGAMLISGCASLNGYQQRGALNLAGLAAPVTILRDEKGMAYIRAASLADALMAQGFVSAQDRLFQMELNRRFAAGRISEFAGEAAVGLDTRMRTLGLNRQAQKHARILDADTRAFFQRYADGVNAYIGTRQETLPLEFRLAGIVPEPWSVADSLAILYLMAWDTAANVQTEIVAQRLVETLGAERARQIFPLNVNPDEPEGAGQAAAAALPVAAPLTGIGGDRLAMAVGATGPLGLGSNNWVSGPAKSQNGKPIVANDPHLDARILPGPWYPVGLVTPALRAVGVNIAGIPGIVVGRTAHMAFGVTNAYGDMQDLYVETVDANDPSRYREGDRSIPFGVVEETLRIRDKKAPGGFRSENLNIRTTGRGPVVSGILKGLDADRVITLRFAPFETMHGGVGFDKLLAARSVSEALGAVRQINMVCLNLVMADTDGNFAWWVTGTLPHRSAGGAVPFAVTDGRDNWDGWIPFENMPHSVNPEKGWLGTCNHDTITKDLPYYYSTYFSPSFRYRRIKQLMNHPAPLSVMDHWRFQRDTGNTLAERLAPLMAAVLATHQDTRSLAEILSRWDFHDDPDQAAPTIFQAIFRNFAFQVFEDELGPQASAVYLNNWYIWEERLLDMALKNDSDWFDDIRTVQVKESRDDILYRAAQAAVAELGRRMGSDPRQWRWGKVHRLELVSPIRRQGFGKGLLGGGSHAFPGSNETLCRGWYDVDAPFDVTHSAALRMVADLADEDKVMAVLPGGVTGRIFHPHHTDQVADYMSGKVRYWWFSDAAIDAHALTRLTLNP